MTPRTRVLARLWLVPAISLLLCSSLLGQIWPVDFVAEPLGGAFDTPVAIAFTDHDHLMVAEKSGVVWMLHDEVRNPTPVVDLSLEVLNNGDRGLLGIVAHPQYHDNGLIYLLYVVDPDGDGADDEQESFGRLTLYTVVLDPHGHEVVDPASRAVLIGATWPEGIPSLHWSHSVGELNFASDGSLWISCGDGAHYDGVDAGGRDPGGFGPDRFPPEEDIGAFRSLSPTSLAGKILRVDPDTGFGLPDNPLYTGDPTENQSRVWALGLRNPFRFAVEPDSAPAVERLYIGDVGWGTWEEFDVCNGGESFGWPCLEATTEQSEYIQVDPGFYCADLPALDPPLWFYHHTSQGQAGFTGQSIASLMFYTGDAYPAQYRGRLFFADYSSDYIRTVRFVDGVPTEVELFGDNVGGPVDLTAHPESGDLYYVALNDNEVRRIRFTTADLPPVVVASATPNYGPVPLDVQLTGSGSHDPEGGLLTFLWDLGDGNTSTLADLTHTYDLEQNATATLTVTDGGGQSRSQGFLISPGNTPPTITAITSPPPGALFEIEDLVVLSATATDAEDDAAGIPLEAQWVVDLIHDHHTHPSFLVLEGFDASFTLDAHGAGTYWQITLHVTDSRELTDTAALDIYHASAPPKSHIVSVSDLSPRLGHAIDVVSHVEFPGLGDAELTLHLGDGTTSTWTAPHQQDRIVSHAYAAPGLYKLRLVSEGNAAAAVAEQDVLVRPLEPAVAVFVPLVYEKWLDAGVQWEIAFGVVQTILAAGHEAELFTYHDQEELVEWMNAYLGDEILDYLILIDAAPALAYQGEDDGSLLETWMESGNGVLWTGSTPFSQYVFEDGTGSNGGAGKKAADELLDAALADLASGEGLQELLPPSADLPSLEEYTSQRALRLGNLGAEWVPFVVYASDTDVPAESDALVLRHMSGGNYAQFFCVQSDFKPRTEVLTEFLLSHLFGSLRSPPPAPALVRPADGQQDVPFKPRLFWRPAPTASSYLVEVAEDDTFELPVFLETVIGATDVTVDPALDAGATHHWRVTARSDYGFTASEPRSFQIRQGPGQ